MKKSSLIKLFLSVIEALSFNTPVLAFSGNQPQIQTMIVTSQILDNEGKMIDPDQDAEIISTSCVITPEKDGTAEVTYQTGNCTPRYFDNH